MAKTHGLSKTRIYSIYSKMIQRCENSKCREFKYYGAKGVKICPEWRNDFLKFYEWSYANGYSDELSIDRIKVNGDYSPENCRWVGRLVQQNNKTNNHFLEFNGETHTLSEWSRIRGIDAGVLWQRVNSGWKAEDVLNPQKVSRQETADRGLMTRYGLECITRSLIIDGVEKTFREWSEISGTSVKQIARRLNELGWTPKEAVFGSNNPNRKGKVLLTINDETHSIAEWKRITGISTATYENRVHRGWSREKALMTPPDTRFRNH